MVFSRPEQPIPSGSYRGGCLRACGESADELLLLSGKIRSPASAPAESRVARFSLTNKTLPLIMGADIKRLQ